jgi:hypothetical protein
MQAYSQAFARVYNMKWTGFVNNVAPAYTGSDLTIPIAEPEQENRAFIVARK